MVLLIVDDDPLVRQAIQLGIGSQYQLLLAGTFAEGVKHLENEDIDGAVIDINLSDPNQDGIDFLALFKKKFPEKPAIMESGYKDIPTVVRCIKLGADDYIEKPFDIPALQLKISKAFADSQRSRVFKRAFEKSRQSQTIVGESTDILRAKQMVEKAANLRILFYGETGVGKTPFAVYSNHIVNQLQEQVRPFEQLNCASLNREQFQDLLFGHKKGAFTGAITDKRGLVELADGGDLFLDEIGDMPLDTQALFLTFLDSMEYYRLGDDKKRKANVRVLAATNKNLKKCVEEGSFRKDLYSRLSQVLIEITPLRDRLGDIPVLVEHFVEIFAGYKKPLAQEVLDTFKTYRWEEGNVRELRDAVEYACLMSRHSDKILLDHLDEKYRPLGPTEILISEENTLAQNLDHIILQHGLDAYLNHVERTVLERYLRTRDESLEQVSKKLKVSRPTLYRRLSKYNIPCPRFSD